MYKRIFGWLIGILVVVALLATVQAKENEFTLQGEGRDTDVTSIDRNVSPGQDLIITITGKSRYRLQSKGKLSLYKGEREKIKDVIFALQPGEAKSWEFPTAKEIQSVNFSVYGKGEIKVMIEQGAQSPAQAITETEPSKIEQAPPETAETAQPSGAASSSFQSLLKDADKFYLSGNKLEAVEKLKQAVLAIWDEVPLTIKNVRLVEDIKTYVARKSNIYSSGENIYITGQMFGYKLKSVGGGYSINITTDIYFLQDGEVLAGQQDFGKFEFISPIPNTEFRLDLTYWFTDAPAGVYDVQTVVHDQNSGKSTKFTTQIEMR